MNTFLPYPNVRSSAECLDYRRLGKQRVEARQILDILLGKTESKAWRNHPATLMWKGCEDALAQYHNAIIGEWCSRGFNNSMPFVSERNVELIHPPWWGNDNFHKSHRSNLLRKDPEWYGKFGWTEPNDLLYFWPTKEGAM